MSRDSDSAAEVSLELSRRRVLVGTATAVACIAGPSAVASAQGTTTGVMPAPERWPDANLAGFEIRYGHEADSGGATEGAGGDGATEDGGGGGDAEGDDQTAADDGTEDGATADGENGGDGGDGETDDGGDGETDDGDGESGTEDRSTDDAEASADDPPECDFGDWPPDDVESHDVRLVNRKQEEEDPEGETPTEDTTLYVSSDVDVEGNAPFLINTFEECDGDFVGVDLESVEGAAVARDDDPEEVEDDPNEAADPGQDDTPAQGPGFGVVAAVAAALGLGGLLSRRRSE